jgi:hypothetical protein
LKREAKRARTRSPPARIRQKRATAVGVVAVVEGVVGEGGAVAEVERPGIDLDVDADVPQGGERVVVEVGTGGAVAQLHDALETVAGRDDQLVGEEVEAHLDLAVAVGHRSRREPVGGGQQRDVPPVVAERHERHADLADDLAYRCRVCLVGAQSS